MSEPIPKTLPTPYMSFTIPLWLYPFRVAGTYIVGQHAICRIALMMLDVQFCPPTGHPTPNTRF